MCIQWKTCMKNKHCINERVIWNTKVQIEHARLRHRGVIPLPSGEIRYSRSCATRYTIKRFSCTQQWVQLRYYRRTLESWFFGTVLTKRALKWIPPPVTPSSSAFLQFAAFQFCFVTLLTGCRHGVISFPSQLQGVFFQLDFNNNNNIWDQ